MALNIEQQFFVDMFRSFLSMRTTPAEGSAYILDAKLGDMELWDDLRLGINMFNTWPPSFTTLRYNDLYAPFKTATDNGEDILTGESTDLSTQMLAPIFMCSLFWTGVRLQWFEAGKHFEYNDNGISLMRKKQADYANIVGGSVLAYLSVQLALIKRSFKMQLIKPKGLFSGSVGFPRSLTRGLRGTRLGYGG